ncbi:MAG: hypothetical protein Q3983_05670 [Capnocytophaga sp.]|nr:hypothetical protein [Capnocytophaga sp.]
MRKIAQVVLLVISLLGFWWIYRSIVGPIEFEEEKQKRFSQVIAKLKDIRNAEEAYFLVNKNYTSNFDELINFIENGSYTITTQRDTSWTEFDKHYKIDVLKQSVVIDTLGKVSVKDSLFKNSDRYKTLAQVPFAKEGTKFELATGVIEKNNFKSPVYEIKVHKSLVLDGLDTDEIAKEIKKKGVNDVKGEYILVGSLQEVSNNGNWPTSYDISRDKK